MKKIYFFAVLAIALSGFGYRAFAVRANIKAASSISQINPIIGPVGTQVAISGVNFTAANNTVTFGNGGAITGLASSRNGRTIVFNVPATMSTNCSFGSNPPICTDAIVRTAPGRYPVTVLNANGRSNAMEFQVTGI